MASGIALESKQNVEVEGGKIFLINAKVNEKDQELYYSLER